MPVNPYLTEANWKANGLPKRTLPEKLKNKKTMISEALRAYATAEAKTVEHSPEKGQALKTIKTRLAAAKASHKGNAALLAHIAKMEQALPSEEQKINQDVSSLTLDTIYATPALYNAFLTFCRDVQHNPEPVEFVKVANSMPKPALVQTFITAGSPKEVNVDRSILDRLEQNPNDGAALKTIYDIVKHQIEQNELPRFKASLRVKL